ncbi:hypothetical protein BJ508DRAFT_361279 [Ascobolus immersus RN42]|uniref:RlpA-like protein double-psi beta-barrel domain-containing protein n=1 Tax=Ascobolus immersus RN42 TaxID=1160509 RepID=A0A3N4ICF4_ASCIM|nr:hypothetical protein BJ508DRAFT_361279 [Ascobolus immersus RN42]
MRFPRPQFTRPRITIKFPKIEKATFQKLFSPNEKFRNWLKARTFGGTTKPKRLYILGFRRKNFFILLAVVSTLAIGIAGYGGTTITKTVNKAEKFEDLQQSSRAATRTGGAGGGRGGGGAGATTAVTTSTAPGGEVVVVPVPTPTGTDGTDDPGNPDDPDDPDDTDGPGETSTDDSETSTSDSAEPTDSAPPPDGEFFEGEATFYAPGIGSCGIESTDADFICAISKERFDPVTPNGNANNNPLCEKKIFVQLAGSKRRRDILLKANSKPDTRTFFTATLTRRGRYYRKKRDEGNEQKPKAIITPPPTKEELELHLEKMRLQKRAGVTITVVDRCPVCKENDLDLSPGAWNAIGADEDAGRVEIEWTFVED